MTIPDEAVQAATAIIRAHDNEAWGEDCGDEPYADLVTRMLTAAAPFLQGVKVKALEWVATGQTGFLETEFYAVAGSLMHTVHPLKDVDGAFNEHYSIHRDWNDREVWRVTYYVGNNGLSGISKVCKSLEAAKSAAQADYEARILSAIEPAPSPRAQALEEGQQLYGPFGHLTGDRNLSEDTWEVYDEPAATTGDIFSIPLYTLSNPFREIGLDVDVKADVLSPSEQALEEADLRELLERLDAGLEYEGDLETENDHIELFNVEAAQELFSDAATAIRALSSQSVACGCSYRILEDGDTIEATDEYLEDDAVTWTPLNKDWSVGGKYHRIFKPMRRPLPASPEVSG